MHNLVLSPIDPQKLIDSIADKVTANILQAFSKDTTIKENPSDLLTPKEASDLLRCSITTLWRHEKTGKVKSSTIGGKRLYKRADLLKALKK